MLGTGTELDPYQVETASDLNDVRNDLTAYYIQMADIDLSGYANWTPIGEDWDISFLGSYDGNNFNISNLTINYLSEGRYCAGLFGWVGDYDGTPVVLKNINLTNVNTLNSCLAGWVFTTTITNCHSSGIVYSNNDEIGSLINSVNEYSIITNCSSTCDIICTGTSKNVGGLISYIEHSILTRCCYLGDITVDVGTTVGGFARYINQSTIEECYAKGSIMSFSSFSNIGGFAYLINNSVIKNNFSMMDISAVTSISTLNGFASGGNSIIENCYVANTYNYGSISNAGGIIANNVSNTITSTYYDYTISLITDNGYGVPKTTLEMKTQTTFVDWDFSSVWGIDSTINNGYPYLRWMNIITTVICRQARPNFVRFKICTTT